MPQMKLTKRAVEDLPLLDQGQIIYWDTELPAFGLVVGKTSKSYVIQRNVQGKNKRVTIGKHGVWTPDTARKEAQELLRDMSRGTDPTAEKRQQKQKSITLQGIFDIFERERESKLSPKTLRNYRDFIRNHLSDWRDTPLRDITSDMAIARHQKLTKASGKYAANHSLKLLQTLYNYAQIEDEELKNPVQILTKKKLWHAKTRRDTFIRENDLARWHSAVLNLTNHSMRDCLRVLLFTGLRRSEACSLEWNNVDFDLKTILIPHTKNGKPLKLPMSTYLHRLLKARWEAKGESPWVFPGEGKAGHISELRKACAVISDNTDIKFMPHDLRRTFITIAETVAPSQYSLKRLLNHSSSDVTAGYIVLDIERLRKVVEDVARKIEKLVTTK